MAHRQDANIRVINLSLGGYDAGDNDTLFHNKIIDAKSAGILTVCAAGNAGNDPNKTDTYGNTKISYPSDYAEVISVTNVTSSNVISSSSDHNQYKDIAAPGTSIGSTYYSDDNSYVLSSGTSMAAPFVSGIAALLFAQNPDLTPAQVQDLLYASATDLGDPGLDNYYGWGLINAEAALNRDKNPPPVLSAGSGSRLNAATTSVYFTSDAEGLFFYKIVESGAATPSIDTTSAGSTLLAGSNNLVLSALVGDTAKDIYIVGKTALSDISTPLKITIPAYIPPDTTAPTLTAGTGARTGAATGTASFTSNEAGRYYYAVVNFGSSAPTVVTSGTGASMTAASQTITLTGLSGNAAKDVYIVGKDAKGNVSAAVKVTIPVYTPPPGPIPDGAYVIHTVDALSPVQAFDISAGSTANGAALQIWGNNTTSAQRFYFEYDTNGYYTIMNVKSGKVLDVPSARAVSGVALWQYAPNGTDAQKWSLSQNTDGSYTIAPKLNTTLCLDIAGASSANGARLQLYTKNGTKAQKFNLQQIMPLVVNGNHKIGSSTSNQVFDVAGNSSSNGANVQLFTDNGTNAQTFKFLFDSNSGYYTIFNATTGKAVDVAGAGTANGANVQMYTSNGTLAQKWTIEQIGPNTYRLYSACSGLVLDAAGGKTTNGTNIQVWTRNNTAAQSWIIN
jgi:hypothetical protein